MAEIKNRIVGSGIVPLDEILFNPRNWRVHPLNQQNALKGVLEEVGWVQDVIINQRTGHLVDGHLRCQLAAREGAKEIPVKYVDLSEDEEALVLSTLDPIGVMAATDKAKLDELFASIETENADVLKMLDDIAEKERLEYGKQEVDAEPQIDRAAELNEKWQVVTGDLWQIGEHRLLCGDSTKREDGERVMWGEKADMVFTDPPYGVDYEGGAGNEIKREKLQGDESGSLYSPSLKMYKEHCVSGAPMYIWFGDRGGKPVYDAVAEIGYQVRAMIVWNKLDAHYGAFMAQYMQKHEPCLYIVNGNANWVGATNEITVWDIKQPSRNEYHPTEKPVELANRAIGNHKADVVADYFCGSGTTMVACQNLNRKCRAIEISPNYCAVVLERMHTAFPELEITRMQ